MRRALGLTLAMLAVAAPAASGEVRKAVQTGGAIVGTCVSTPCELQYAITQAATDDVVELASSAVAYARPEGYEVNKRITVRGAAGARPIVSATSGGFPALKFVAPGGNGATAEHLAFNAISTAAVTGDATGVTVRDALIDTIDGCISLATATVEDLTAKTSSTDDSCVVLVTGSTARRITVTTANNGGASAAASLSGTAEDITVTAKGVGVLANNLTLRRARVTTEDGDGIRGATEGATVTDSFVVSKTGIALTSLSGLSLRNVTAIGAIGIRAPLGIANFASNIGGTNVIARGTTADVEATQTGFCAIPQCPPGTISLSFSNVRTPAGPGITYGAGMQSGDPKFVSATDLHLATDSPARDAGTAEGVDSTKDIDGEARVQGDKVDIGADELVALPVVPDTSGGGGGGTTAPASPTTNVIVNVPPVLSLLKAGKKGVVTFTLSEVAKLAVKVERQAAGKKKGAKCVAPTPKFRRAKACTRFIAAGTATLQGAAGANTKTILVKGKALKPGTYRLTFTPTDALGMPGRPATVTLKVTAPKKKPKKK